MRRAVTYLALAVMLFLAQGAYLVHPLLHGHHPGHACHTSAPEASGSLLGHDAPPHAGQEGRCPICDWLASLHAQPSATPALTSCLASQPQPLPARACLLPSSCDDPSLYDRGPPPPLS